MITDAVRTKVAVDLLSIPPLLFRGVRRKLFKRSLVGIDVNITPIHYEILQLVEEKGPLHIAEIGLRLQIAKAQMTQLLNRLVDAKLVESKSDPEDRRVANISITENGKSILIEHRNSRSCLGRRPVGRSLRERIGRIIGFRKSCKMS